MRTLTEISPSDIRVCIRLLKTCIRKVTHDDRYWRKKLSSHDLARLAMEEVSRDAQLSKGELPRALRKLQIGTWEFMCDHLDAVDGIELMDLFRLFERSDGSLLLRRMGKPDEIVPAVNVELG